MKSTFLFALLLLAGCRRGDTELHDQIAGTWKGPGTFEMTLAADGTFVSQSTLPAKRLTYQGTWKVQDGGVVSTLTNCNAEGTTNFQAVGSVEHWAILRADRTDLVWSNNGQTISFKRK